MNENPQSFTFQLFFCQPDIAKIWVLCWFNLLTCWRTIYVYFPNPPVNWIKRVWYVFQMICMYNYSKNWPYTLTLNLAIDLIRFYNSKEARIHQPVRKMKDLRVLNSRTRLKLMIWKISHGRPQRGLLLAIENSSQLSLKICVTLYHQHWLRISVDGIFLLDRIRPDFYLFLIFYVIIISFVIGIYYLIRWRCPLHTSTKHFSRESIYTLSTYWAP